MKDKTKVAIVDVDNTICEFSPVLFDELRKINRHIPHYTNWNKWDFYDTYVSEDEFFEAAHLAQMRIDETAPVVGARKLLEYLRENSNVVIASHRREDSRESLIEWLDTHRLPYDELHISFDKTRLFNGITKILIDDAPSTIQIGVNHGLVVAALKKPWNKHISNCGAFFGDDLIQVCEYLNGVGNE